MLHEIKTFKANFDNIKKGVKDFEVVGKDMNCQIGDTFVIKEVVLGKTVCETGNKIFRKIKFISDYTNDTLKGILNNDFCIVGFEQV